MVKWTKEHPFGAHIINIGIVLLIVLTGVFYLKYTYGDKIIKVYRDTIIIKNVVTKIPNNGK